MLFFLNLIACQKDYPVPPFSQNIITFVSGISQPDGLTIDNSGNMYITAQGTHSLVKVTPDGNKVTLAGVGIPGNVDGDSSTARFNTPDGVTADSSGNIYVADTGNNSIRKVTPSGNVSTIYNTGLSAPTGISLDSSGNLYVADSGNNQVKKITTSGTLLNTYGTGTSGSGDGSGSSASFNGPHALSVDKTTGNVFITDENNNSIRKIDSNGNVSTIAGGSEGYTDGIGSSAKFKKPHGIAVDSGSGNVYVSDAQNNCVRFITPSGVVITYAGNGIAGDGNGFYGQFNQPRGVAIDTSGNVCICDYGNGKMKIISSK